MVIGTLPAGTRGFDANTRVTVPQARAFRDAGYKFAVRGYRTSAFYITQLSQRSRSGMLSPGSGEWPG
jgi:hypothetical protein